MCSVQNSAQSVSHSTVLGQRGVAVCAEDGNAAPVLGTHTNTTSLLSLWLCLTSSCLCHKGILFPRDSLIPKASFPKDHNKSKFYEPRFLKITKLLQTSGNNILPTGGRERGCIFQVANKSKPDSSQALQEI